MTATDLKKRAIALAEKTKIDSVTPEEVGQLSNDIVEYIENVEINGSSLGIRKTYTSVSAMEAESTAPKDDKGVLLRRGMLVNIYNQEEPDSADNGKVFSFQNPGWAFRGTIDAGYATKEELTELESEKILDSNNLRLYQGSIYLGGNLKENKPNTKTKNRCYVPVFKTQDVMLGVPDDFRVNMIYGDYGCNSVGEVMYDVNEITTEYPYGLITISRKDNADFTPDDVKIIIKNKTIAKQVETAIETINKIVPAVNDNGTNIENISAEIGMLVWDRQGTSVRVTDGEKIEAENRRITYYNKISDVKAIFPDSSRYYIIYYDKEKEWISSDGWKTDKTYILSDNKPLNAEFFIILINTEITNYTEIYLDKNVNKGIDNLRSQVKNNEIEIEAIQETIGNNGKASYKVEWQNNAINSIDGSDGKSPSYEETRKRTVGFIPVSIEFVEITKEIGQVFQIMFYDESNAFIETYPETYIFSSEKSLNISDIKTENAKYYRMCIKYPDVDTSDINFSYYEKSGLFKDIEEINERIAKIESGKKNANILIVDSKGNGDYTTIEEALNNANDTDENHVVIYVMPGVYYPAPKTGENVPYKENNRNVSIVGLDRNSCILKGDVGYYYYQIKVDYALIRLNGNITIANLTFDNRSDKYTETAQENGWDLSTPHCRAYCIHADGERQAGSIIEIKNCRMYNDHFTCVGFGTRVDSTLRMVDCDVISDVDEEKEKLSSFKDYGTIYGHLEKNSTQPNQNLEIVRCRIENTRHETAINLMDAAGEGAEGNAVLIQNVCATTNKQNAYKTVSKFILNKLSFGNNIEKMNS